MATFSNDNFVATKKMATVTFSGWDGKSYNGEARNMRVYTNPEQPGKEFVRALTRGNKVLTYHLITSELHKVSGVKKVQFFTYFDAD